MFTGQSLKMREHLYQKTAILLFANSPEEEMKHKGLIRAKGLYTDLTAQTVRTIRGSGLPYFHYSENEQRGKGFGERFYNAISEVFQRGYDYIITLGNDSPGLSKEHLINAAIQLKNGKVVLGPSRDGGFYLMGFHSSQFELLKFLAQPWQSSELQVSFVNELLTNDFEIKFLDELVDIDNLDDILDLLRTTTLLPLYILNYIRQLIQTVGKALSRLPILSDTRLDYSYYNKGSPLFIGDSAA